jgi:transposase
VHADETYWVLDGQRAYYWVHATEQYIHFQFDTSRAGEVSRELLGTDFAGTLVTDCYSAYDAQGAKAKQKCLSHLARTARDWQKLTSADSPDYCFFESVKEWVKRGCDFHRRRERLSPREQADEKAWLRAELQRLQSCPLTYEKAVTLQERIKRYADCWLVFLDDPRVPPTNNHAERTLRPLVILRKITFGHRTPFGATAMARLMTIQETAKRHGRRVLDIFYRLAMLASEFPDDLLRYIYAGPGMAGT